MLESEKSEREIADLANYTVLVDRDIADKNWIGDFLRARARDPLCRLILLVNLPDLNDWQAERHPDIEFDVIVRNSGKKRDVEFKMHALTVIRETSAYNVVSALDGNYYVRNSYRHARIPFVFDERGHLEGIQD